MSFLTEKKLIGGHRGSPRKAHENTIDSFSAAIEEGFDFVELDIRMSSDNILVVHHDPSTRCGHFLEKMTFKEIKSLKNITGYEIPPFEEVLELCAGKIMIDAEIKEENITERTVKALLKYYQKENFIVTSFSQKTVETLKTMFPEVLRGILLKWNFTGNVHKIIETLDPDFILPHHIIYSRKAKPVCKKYGIKAIPYTVNSVKEMKKLFKDPFVAGIITDNNRKAVDEILLKK